MEDVFYLVHVDIAFTVPLLLSKLCLVDTPEGVGIAITLSAKYIFAVNGLLLAIKMAFTLQLLHVSDFECGIDIISTSPQTSDAVRFSALLNRLQINY
ncbi:MAG: hypothetical protein V7K92_17725 [Nostoc sp.]|uniref:hypothetical protein n=1 Tax=Nostoc sp. TaxID=1180 RepID=UPI002FF2CC13